MNMTFEDRRDFDRVLQVDVSETDTVTFMNEEIVLGIMQKVSVPLDKGQVFELVRGLSSWLGYDN